ncbi:MAG: hypothetical protein Q9181_001232 [Wetmoreana brouardii]
MWAQSLQTFPEHRSLHLSCNSGISTAVVLCHHVLGFTVTVNIQGAELRFGNGNANIHIEESETEYAEATLMEPADPHQPLFKLIDGENDLSVSYEMREEAFGFGLKVLRHAGLSGNEINDCTSWIITRALALSDPGLADEDNRNMRHTAQLQWIRPFHQAKYPEERRLLQASRFLFALDNISLRDQMTHRVQDKELASKVDLVPMVAVLVSFARIHESDLERCHHLPLSVREYQRLHKKEHCIKFLEIRSRQELLKAYAENVEFNLINSFELLGRLMLGRRYTEQYAKPAVLLSAWGWSIFFSSIDAVDPGDVSVTAVRLLFGVPVAMAGERLALSMDQRKSMGKETEEKS